MGARKTTMSGGGGFLSGVDGTITGYNIAAGETTIAKAGQRKGEEFTPLNMVLSVRQDGVEDIVTTRLLVGSTDEFEVSADGQTLTPIEGRRLWNKSQLGLFITSLETLDQGCSDDTAPEGVYNFNPIVGLRCRFEQQPDENGKKRTYTGRDGKTHETVRTHLVVSQVYGKVELPKAGKSTSKVNGSGKVDIAALTEETVAKVLEQAGGAITKAKLSVKIAQVMGVKHPQREDVRKMALSEAWLSGGSFVYDPDTQTLSA